MKKRIVYIFLFFLSCVSFNAYAQLRDAGGIGSISVSKEISKVTELSFEQELRLDQGLSMLNRSSTSIGADFTIVRRLLKAEVDYILMYRREDFDLYEFRHRFTAGFVFQQRYSRFIFKLRTRGQTTLRDENRGDYKYNPRYVWRNRLQVEYNIPKSPFRPYISTEIFCPLNSDYGFFMDSYRLIIGTTYRFSKRSELDCQIRFDQDVQVANPKNILYTGIGWNYSF